MKGKMLTYDPELEFRTFLKELRKQSTPEWQWLLDMFREKVKPWLFKIDGNLPPGAISSVEEFIEEVFANSLFRFTEQFHTGSFNSLADLRGLMFRIAEYKLKEGYHKIRRDRLIYFTDDVQSDPLTHDQKDLSSDERSQLEVVAEVREQLSRLGETDRNLLVRFARGEELGSIAMDLGLTPAACRKRKQRAMEKLKSLVLKTL